MRKGPCTGARPFRRRKLFYLPQQPSLAKLLRWRWDFVSLYPIHVDILAGLIFSMPSSCKISYYEFVGRIASLRLARWYEGWVEVINQEEEAQGDVAPEEKIESWRAAENRREELCFFPWICQRQGSPGNCRQGQRRGKARARQAGRNARWTLAGSWLCTCNPVNSSQEDCLEVPKPTIIMPCRWGQDKRGA